MKRKAIQFVLTSVFVFAVFLIIYTPSFAVVSQMGSVSKLIANAAAAPVIGPPVFAVVPFHTDNPANPLGSQIQQRNVQLLKTIWPNVILKQISESVQNSKEARALLVRNGVDWLLWGSQEAKADGGTRWTYGIVLSERMSNDLKTRGLGQTSEVVFQKAPDAYLSRLLKFTLGGSTKLVLGLEEEGKLSGLKDEIDESDDLLDTLQKAAVDADVILAVKAEQAPMLNAYGLKTADNHMVRRAKKIFQELLLAETDAKSSKSHEYQMGLGLAEMELGNPSEAVEAFEKSLAAVDKTVNPIAWLDTQTQLAQAYIYMGGTLNEDEAELKGVDMLEAVLLKLDKKTQLNRWVAVQNSLGLAYQSLAARAISDKYNQLSMDHLLAALSEAKGVLPREGIAMLETNLSADYAALGDRQRNSDYLNQAVVAAQGAVDTYRKTKNDLLLANALIYLAGAQSSLGQSLGDISAVQAAKDSLDEAIKTYPKDTNGTQVLTANMMKAAADMEAAHYIYDPASLKEGLAILESQLKMSSALLENNPAFFRLRASLLLLSATESCNDKVFDQAMADAQTSYDLALRQKNNLGLLSAEMIQASIEDGRGYGSKDPKRLVHCVALFHSVLDEMTKQSIAKEECSLLSSLCDAYGDLLVFEATPQELADAKGILKRFKECQTAVFPNEANANLKTEAELTYALAAHEGNLDEIKRSLGLIQQTQVFFQQKGMLIEVGIVDEQIGRMYLSIYDKTKEVENLHLAQVSFNQAVEALKNLGPCMKRDATEGLIKVNQLLSGTNQK